MPSHWLCWAYLIRDLTAIAERPGASAEFGAELLGLQQQLFTHWHHYKYGTIERHALQQACRQLLQVSDGLWIFLEIEGIEPTNNTAVDAVFSVGVRALHQSVIQRKISHGVQSRQGAICRSRLLTVTTTLRQQGRDVWSFLEQAWIAHHRGGLMPSLLPDA